jgi:hypothetical protein
MHHQGGMVTCCTAEYDKQTRQRSCAEAETVITDVKSSRAMSCSSCMQEESEFKVADGWLCPAVAVAVKTMKKGEAVALRVRRRVLRPCCLAQCARPVGGMTRACSRR